MARQIIILKSAQKFIIKLPTKQSRQVKDKALSLLDNPLPSDSTQLKGSDYFRVDIGEYRIIYALREDIIVIPLIGKRNDGEVYKRFKRLMR